MYLCFKQNELPMEIICIEAGIFEEMNNVLQEIIHKMPKRRSQQHLTEWMDNQEVCIMLNISLRKLLTLRQTGAIPYSRIDRKIYYLKKDIDLFMQQELQKGNA